MNGGILFPPPSRVARRDGMTSVLTALADGLLPVNWCPGCHLAPGGRCEDCARRIADAADVNAAIDAVEGSKTEADALAAYAGCLLGLAGTTRWQSLRLLLRILFRGAR